VKKCDNAAIYC